MTPSSDNLPHPVFKIPSEMLAKIFIAYLRLNGIHAKSFLSLLKLVCREWCEIVMETPELWTDIDLEMRLSRSQRLALRKYPNARLNITLPIGVKRVLMPARHLQHLDLIERAHTLNLAVPSEPFDQILLDVPILGLAELNIFVPQLSARTFHFQNIVDFIRSRSPVLHQLSPNLSSLSLELWNDGNYIVPNDYRMIDLLRAIASLPLLAELKFVNNFNKETTETLVFEDHGILFPKLSILEFENVDSSSLQLFFQATSLPKLQRLRLPSITAWPLEEPANAWQYDWEDIHDFTRDYEGNLTVLEIQFKETEHVLKLRAEDFSSAPTIEVSRFFSPSTEVHADLRPYQRIPPKLLRSYTLDGMTSIDIIPHENITSLSIISHNRERLKVKSFPEPEYFVPLLEKLSNLMNIGIYGMDTRPLLQVLLEDLDLCPVLEVLSLKNSLVDFEMLYLLQPLRPTIREISTEGCQSKSEKPEV
ncbi:hypothetical protein SISSUDRAFT_1034370 [Sistotremastrum suecicum HHB10207 ss-3]|uniref:Uncharacterized protein n=1 Tax=Sistotremastrum suecicum HHB10207 ss-3 TaxID=1314776 RepID=A0A166C3U7_9AGAM|nr:hypothetical protein SISSUDRAFT_1034370 [Sistotremastrum suecicum HHB10207 ss-3]